MSAEQIVSKNNPDRMDDIIVAAVNLFARKGYHATSITDISEAVGLGRGALYYYIRSKEDLLWECHNRYVQPIIDFGLMLEQQPGTPEEKLRSLSKRLIELIATNQPYLTVFYHEMKALPPDRYTALAEKSRHFEDVIERIICQGLEEGQWVGENARMCVLAFLGMHNWSSVWYKPQGPLSPDEIADSFIRLFLKGLERRD